MESSFDHTKKASRRRRGDSHDAGRPAARPEPRRGRSSAAGLPHFLNQSREPPHVFVKAKLDGEPAGPRPGGASHANPGEPAPLSFPHAARISGALETPLTLKGVLDPVGCAVRGTPAFTDGDVTHFAEGSPRLHVAAHEAAHQLQHAGVAHDFGLGAEGHASAVADFVASGRPAAGLVGPTGERVSSARRNYVEADAQGNPIPKGPARLSETGETLTFHSQVAYATKELIDQSNGILEARGSGVKISSGGGGPSVVAPEGGATNSLLLVKVEIAADKTGQTMPGDCREAAIEVMGKKPGEEFPEKAVCHWAGEQTLFRPPSDKIDTPPADFNAMLNFIEQRVRETPNYDKLSPEEQRKVREEAISAFTGKVTRERMKLRHVSLPDERAKQLGVDKYAAPEVGQAYGMILEKPPRPGSDAMHFAGVIMAPGPDRVTLENLGTHPGERSDKWFISTYGTKGKPDQSFHEKWMTSEGRHTFVMQTKPQPPDYAGQLATMSTVDLCARYSKSTDPDETLYLTGELEKRSVQVEVFVDKQQEWFSDRVYVVVKGAGSAESKSKTLAEGQSHVFNVPVLKLLPLGPSLTVSVHEWDFLGDDFIGSIPWSAPFAPTAGNTVSGSDATYTVSVSMSGPSGAAPAAPAASTAPPPPP